MNKYLSDVAAKAQPVEADQIIILDSQQSVEGRPAVKRATIASILPAAVESIVAGDGISVDDSDPKNPVVSADVRQGIQSIVAGEGISVDDSDPLNPVVSGHPAPVLNKRFLAYVLQNNPPSTLPSLVVFQNDFDGNFAITRTSLGRYSILYSGNFGNINKVRINSPLFIDSADSICYIQLSNISTSPTIFNLSALSAELGDINPNCAQIENGQTAWVIEIEERQ